MKIKSRNDRLMKTAVNNTIKRNGGYLQRVLPKYLEQTILSAANFGKKDKISEKDFSRILSEYIGQGL